MRRVPYVFAIAALALVLPGCGSETLVSHIPPSDAGIATPTSDAVGQPSKVSETDVQAAKQAYLDYVDAVGRMDPKDPATFSRAFALATGEQLNDDHAFYSQLADQKWTVTGRPKVAHIDFINADSASAIQFDVCMDSSAVRFFDAQGRERQASPARVQLLTATVTREADGTWLVSNHVATQDPQPC